MGRSQRANRSPSRKGLREDSTAGADSRGETHYPSTGDGYVYNWANNWPSGSTSGDESPPDP